LANPERRRNIHVRLGAPVSMQGTVSCSARVASGPFGSRRTGACKASNDFVTALQWRKAHLEARQCADTLNDSKSDDA